MRRREERENAVRMIGENSRSGCEGARISTCSRTAQDIKAQQTQHITSHHHVPSLTEWKFRSPATKR
jgi:hypothetical protein